MPTTATANSTKQQRSRETLERILAAAERLLESRDFEGLTMTDLAHEAGCAVGTVYARVPNKETLLVCLHERYVAAGEELSVGIMRDAAQLGLEGRARAMCDLVVEYLSSHRGVTRAVSNWMLTHEPDASHVFRSSATTAFKEAAGFLAATVDSSVHDDPTAAAEFALLAVLDVAQDRLVYGDRSRVRLRLSKKELKRRLNHMLLAYLTHEASA